MAATVYPAPAAGSKTRYVVTLLSGTSYTVPAGVTYVNATLIGGGSGGGFGGGAGGKSPGLGGQKITTNVSTTPGASIAYAIGAGGGGGVGTTNSSIAGGTTSFTGATSAAGGVYVTDSNASTTPQTSRQGEVGGNGGLSAGTAIGGTGGAGKIELEYWV